MSKSLLESVLGDQSEKFTTKEKNALLESLNNVAADIAEERIKNVEDKYASQFSSITESVSTTLVEMAEDAFKKATEKIVKEDSVNYLMENVAKIQGILEDIGLVTLEDGGIKERIEKEEEKYKKALELLKKSKDLVDKKRDQINKLSVENYIRKSMTGMEKDLVDSAIENFGDEDIDDIEDTLINWLDSEDYSIPSAPKEKDISSDFNEDEIENDLNELDEMVEKGMFESEDGTTLKKPEKNGKLDNIKGLHPITSANGKMGDVSSTQLEALNNFDDSLFEDESSQILDQDVDQAVKQMRNFGKNWQL